MELYLVDLAAASWLKSHSLLYSACLICRLPTHLNQQLHLHTRIYGGFLCYVGFYKHIGIAFSQKHLLKGNPLEAGA